MSSRIEIRPIEPQPAVVICAKTNRAEIGTELAVLLPEAFQHVISNGGKPAGMPFVRYTGVSGDTFDIEAGVPVEAPVPEAGRVKNIVLPGGRAAVLRHIGPYEQLEGAYRRMEQWFNETGQGRGGAPWEVYVTDPGAEPDSSKWITDIYHPVV